MPTLLPKTLVPDEARSDEAAQHKPRESPVGSWNREPGDDSDDQGKGSDPDDRPQRDPDCDWHALSLHVRSNVSPRPANKGWTAQYPYFETRTKSERTAVSGSMKSARRPGFQTARPSQSCIMEETVMVAPLKKSE